MDKRLFQTFFLTLVLLIIWSYLFPPQKTKPPQDSPVLISPEEPAKAMDFQAQTSPLAPPPSDETDITLPRTPIGNFDITFSPTGGYIKELIYKPTGDSLPYRNIGYVPSDHTNLYTYTIEDDRIFFQAQDNAKSKEYIFDGNRITINFSQPLEVPVLVFSNYPISDPLDARYQEHFYNLNNTVIRRNFQNGFLGLFGKGIEEGIHRNITYAGARDRYYCLSLINSSYEIEWTIVKYKEKFKGKDIEKVFTNLYLPSLSSSAIQIYVGPQISGNLKAHGLEGIINYGLFHSIGVLLTKILYLIFSVTKSWGLTIIVFSITIYIALFPFTAKSMKSMRKIQELQPELDLLREKYKDNPQKFQKESMGFYREHKINPAGGCLPLLLQFPIFIALYQALLRLFDLKDSSFLWIKDLSEPDKLFTLPFTLPLLNSQFFNLLPILIVVIAFVQQKITVTKGSAASQQKGMGLFMVFFMGFILYNFPSALVMYWFTQNLFGLLYQMRIAQVKKQPKIIDI